MGTVIKLKHVFIGLTEAIRKSDQGQNRFISIRRLSSTYCTSHRSCSVYVQKWVAFPVSTILRKKEGPLELLRCDRRLLSNSSNEDQSNDSDVEPQETPSAKAAVYPKVLNVVPDGHLKVELFQRDMLQTSGFAGFQSIYRKFRSCNYAGRKRLHSFIRPKGTFFAARDEYYRPACRKGRYQCHYEEYEV